jgi:hypothetical protein
MAKRENRRAPKIKGSSAIVAGTRSWQGATKQRSGEQSPKTISRAKHA